MDNLILGDDLHQNSDLSPYSDKNKNIDRVVEQYVHKPIVDYSSKCKRIKTEPLDNFPKHDVKLVLTPCDYYNLCKTFDVQPQSDSMPEGKTTTSIQASEDMNTMMVPMDQEPMVVHDGVASDADIATFLSRKIQVQNFSWGVGTNIDFSFKPWTLFLVNPAVLRKIHNYKLVKGDLVLTFYVNGTPFHAGMLLTSYCYMSSENDFPADINSSLITHSQRPHIFLNASTNKSGCLCLPFFSPEQFIDIQTGKFAPNDIGEVNIQSFLPLTQLNGGTDTVTISVFAHMENVKLAAPTTWAYAHSGHSLASFDMFDIQPQTEDEYEGKGPVSKIASQVASAAGKLTMVPYLAPFAMATQIGAGAIGSIASLFGYSRPAQIHDIMPMRNFPVSSLALVDSVDTSQKLTATSKQELCVDPRTVGLPPVDELSIKSFCERESYVTSFPWTTLGAIGATLFRCDVSPMLELRTTLANGTRITPTSLSYISRCFGQWTGSLRFRFQIIGTQFHRGRIALCYDPAGDLTGDPFNTTFNTVMDLSEARDFTIEIPWQQSVAYQNVELTKTTMWEVGAYISPGVSSYNDHTNGMFFIRVVNELVTPDATLPINIMVSVSAGDDFRLANPTGFGASRYKEFTPLAGNGPTVCDFSMFDIQPQSSVEMIPPMENRPDRDPDYIKLIDTTDTHTDQKPLMYYGEAMTSIRQLLKRYGQYRWVTTTETFIHNYQQYIYYAMPLAPGYDPDGADKTSLGTDYNYVGMTYMTYFRRCFAGWRGSTRWKFVNVDGSTSYQHAQRLSFESARVLALGNRADFFLNLDTNLGISNFARFPLESGQSVQGMGGAALTTNSTMNALEVEIPYASRYRFSPMRPYTALLTNGDANGFPGGDAFSITSIGSGRAHNRNVVHVAAGDDFSFFGFIGAPVFYVYANPPADPVL